MLFISIKAEGYWADVPYGPPLLSENHPTKGFIAVDGFRIAAIGHVWFPEQQPPGNHYFLFNSDSRIAGEYQPHKIILSGPIGEINADVADKLIYLATSFRETYKSAFTESLDRCLKEVRRLTEKRK